MKVTLIDKKPKAPEGSKPGEEIPAFTPANPPEKAKSSLTRVAAYCRVSTEQEEQAGSFENQVKTYKEKITGNPEWEFAGIYADEGISGTEAEKRAGFQKMMADAREGKFDRLITKSISRFARNVIDSLKYTRELKSLGIPVDFEEEHINSMDPGAEMIFTILAAVAEQESRNISEHTKWGIRSGYKRGIYNKYAVFKLYGYRRGEDGEPMVEESEAEIIRMIYKNFLEGYGYGEIATNLIEMGVDAGGRKWNYSSVQDILENEKYEGDVRLQKRFVQNFMEHKLVKNEGQLEQFYIRDAHPGIVDRETWQAVQEEIKRREGRKDRVGRKVRTNGACPYSGKIFYKGACKALIMRHAYGTKAGGSATWKCRYYKSGYKCVCHDPAVVDGLDPKDYPLCPCFTISEAAIRKFFIAAWNDIIDDNLKKTRLRWTGITTDPNISVLQKVRAKQMLELTAAGAGAKLTEEVPEIVRMTLDHMDVEDPRHADVYFLDGTVKSVTLPSQFAWEDD